MDRGTKIYSIVLAVIVLSLAVVFLYESPKVSELNSRLDSVADIHNFVYRFKVLRIDNKTAVMSSPRSTQVPVSRILGVLFPRVKGKSTQSDEFQKAQKALAEVQTQARDLVLADNDITQVRWELDRNWLLQHGITP